MQLQSELESWFENVSEVDVGGMRGRKFICDKMNGEQLFVKAREKKEWDWFEWGLRKERRVCSSLSQHIQFVPNSPVLFETPNYIVVGFEFKQNNNELSYDHLYTDEQALKNVLSDLNSLLVWLYENSGELGVNVKNIKGREQVTRNRNFESMESYIFGERLREGVYFGGQVYEEYEDVLNQVADNLEHSYDEKRNRFIHGDIQNTNNVLFNANGVFGVVDWEISGWFDYLYDVGFVEASYIDKPLAHNESLNKHELQDVLYDGLDIHSEDEKIIDLYKVWPHYLSLESLYVYDEVNEEIKSERNIQRSILDSLLGEASPIGSSAT